MSRTLTVLRVGACAAVLATGGGALAQSPAPPQAFAGRLADGTVRVLYVGSDRPWPAGGVRLEDDQGQVLAPALPPGASQAGAGKVPLDAEEQHSLQALQAPRPPDERGRAAGVILALRLATDWDFARAAGAAFELPAGTRARKLRFVLLGADGASVGMVGPFAVLQDPGPPAIAALHATAAAAGVDLQWPVSAARTALPVVAYAVERLRAAGGGEALTPHPRLLTLDKSRKPIAFLDGAPPVGLTVSYDVRLVDVLGVSGPAARVQVYSPDFEAAAPPRGLAVKAGRGKVTLSWVAGDNARTAGWVVERAQLIDGPFERLQEDGLGPRIAQYEDRQLVAGARYFYRVRAYTADGYLGPAGDVVAAQAQGGAPPNAPQALAAEAGIDQVVLHWQPVTGGGLAGYQVERRASSKTERWARLNDRLVPQARFVDPIGPSAGGSFEYRVFAVAGDESTSAPSAVLTVQLLAGVPPDAPLIRSASGADARVRIEFTPALPAERTAQVALVRADTATDAGLVVGAPVAGTAGAIEDGWVRAGRTYWYRLVAFDRNGNRSAESDSVKLRVGAARLPVPKAPRLQYADRPAPQVTLAFDPPPAHARVLVEVLRDDGRWQVLTGPVSVSSAVDAAPAPHASYRLVYVDEEGRGGQPSPAVVAR